MLDDNKISHELYLNALDLSDALKKALPQEKDDIFDSYNLVIAKLCKHYQ
jgi:hypothetical protein